MQTSSISKRLATALQECQSRGFNRFYIAVDLHGTLIKPDYESREPRVELYPHAKDFLSRVTKSKAVKLIMYTCSWPREIEEYRSKFAIMGIEFDPNYVNRNPEAENTKYGYYQDKMYCSILLDDKAGFDATCDEEGHNDWSRMSAVLDEMGEIHEYLSDLKQV